MNRIGLALLAWLFLGLETGLRGTLRLWSPEVSPGFVFVLIVFIAMCGPGRAVAWWALAGGLLIDLTTPLALKTAGPAAVIVGPHAIAYLVGAQLVLAMRGVMIRRNPLTLGFLSLGAGLVAHAVLVAIFWIRARFDPIEFHATSELVDRLAGAAYTGVVAIALAFVLLPMAEFIGLPSQTRGRFGR
ncbi:hypothetical protein PHYC_03226 [Phycisphaerales bacterium]|nr:hypothetical protein PHYC_03226 [Phycisphaerales bacterium]